MAAARIAEHAIDPRVKMSSLTSMMELAVRNVMDVGVKRKKPFSGSS